MNLILQGAIVLVLIFGFCLIGFMFWQLIKAFSAPKETKHKAPIIFKGQTYEKLDLKTVVKRKLQQFKDHMGITEEREAQIQTSFKKTKSTPSPQLPLNRESTTKSTGHFEHCVDILNELNKSTARFVGIEKLKSWAQFWSSNTNQPNLGIIECNDSDQLGVLLQQWTQKISAGIGVSVRVNAVYLNCKIMPDQWQNIFEMQTPLLVVFDKADEWSGDKRFYEYLLQTVKPNPLLYWVFTTKIEEGAQLVEKFPAPFRDLFLISVLENSQFSLEDSILLIVKELNRHPSLKLTDEWVAEIAVAVRHSPEPTNASRKILFELAEIGSSQLNQLNPRKWLNQRIQDRVG